VKIEIVVVLGRIDLHLVGNAFEDESEHRLRVVERQREGFGQLVDILLVGVNARALGRGSGKRHRRRQQGDRDECKPMKPKRVAKHESESTYLPASLA